MIQRSCASLGAFGSCSLFPKPLVFRACIANELTHSSPSKEVDKSHESATGLTIVLMDTTVWGAQIAASWKSRDLPARGRTKLEFGPDDLLSLSSHLFSKFGHMFGIARSRHC